MAETAGVGVPGVLLISGDSENEASRGSLLGSMISMLGCSFSNGLRRKYLFVVVKVEAVRQGEFAWYRKLKMTVGGCQSSHTQCC